jgi:hypothetical protein
MAIATQRSLGVSLRARNGWVELAVLAGWSLALVPGGQEVAKCADDHDD